MRCYPIISKHPSVEHSNGASWACGCLVMQSPNKTLKTVNPSKSISLGYGNLGYTTLSTLEGFCDAMEERF